MVSENEDIEDESDESSEDEPEEPEETGPNAKEKTAMGRFNSVGNRVTLEHPKCNPKM